MTTFLFWLISSATIGGGLLTIFSSIRIISEGNEALVERFGRYDRKLTSGLNMVLPVLETIVVEDTVREKVLEIDPQQAISKDNVSLRVDAVVYWKIMDLEKTFYVVEDIKSAIRNLVLTTLRSQIGLLELDETYSSRDQINKALIKQLDEATEAWGVKATRIEVREISPAKNVMDSLELERAAESKKRAEIAEAEGIVESIKMLTNTLGEKPNAQRVLEFLVAQRYMDASEKLGESENSKVVFMNPNMLNEAITDLMGEDSKSVKTSPILPPTSNGTPTNGETA